MGLRCALGHESDSGVLNAGLVFGTCWRCGRDVIRVPGGRWYPVPKGYVVRWKVEGTHAARPGKLIRLARSKVPLHRLRRRPGLFDAYFIN